MHEAVRSSNNARRLSFGHSSRAAKVLLLIIALLLVPLARVFAIDDFYPDQQFVKYEKDNVSIAFTNLRASEAASLMRSTTGIAISLPASIERKTINLTLHGEKLDQAVRYLLKSLELNNSFLIYDGAGRLTRVVALEKAAIRSISQESEDDKKKTSYRELNVNEVESILRDFGRWSELTAEEQKTIHARLKTIPPSRVRDQIVQEYVRQVLEVADSPAMIEEHRRHPVKTQARLSPQLDSPALVRSID
jgi:hypothetical protein